MPPNQIQPVSPGENHSSITVEGQTDLGALGSLGAAPPLPEPGIPWGRYISALRRYKWLILGIVSIGTAASVGATRFLEPEYRATATIYIEPPPDDAGPIRGAELLRSFGWLELLNTGVVLDSVALSQRLYLTPDRVRDSLAFTGFTIADTFVSGQYRLVIDKTGTAWSLGVGAGGRSRSWSRRGFRRAEAGVALGSPRPRRFARVGQSASALSRRGKRGSGSPGASPRS